MPEPEPRELRDDPTLAGDVPVLRQVNPARTGSCVDWAQLDNSGTPRLRGGAFQRASLAAAQRYGYPTRTLSLYVESAVIEEYGSVIEWAGAVRPGWGVVRLPAALLRSEGQYLIERDDLNGWIGHSVAWAGGSSSRADAAQKALADGSQWVVAPDPDLA